jgi:dihydrofolate reductase
MRKIKLYIASSIDGFIARPDGDLDWLTGFPNPEKSDYGYKIFNDSVDTVIMGERTCHNILALDVKWPYQGKKCYIISNSMGVNSPGHDIELITENVIEEISCLKEDDGKDIWLAGGGKSVSLLLDAGLLDSMIITYIPKVLGDGIPLFPDRIKESDWSAVNTQSYENGVVQVEYQVRN